MVGSGRGLKKKINLGNMIISPSHCYLSVSYCILGKVLYHHNYPILPHIGVVKGSAPGLP